MRFQTALILGLTLPAAPMAAQTIDEIAAAAGQSMDSIVCSAFFALDEQVILFSGVPDATAAAEASGRRASILVAGASVLRMGEFDETADVAMDTAAAQADALQAILLENYRTDGKAAFDSAFDVANRMPYCETKVKGVAEALQQGLGD